jgi:hypothetical protein
MAAMKPKGETARSFTPQAKAVDRKPKQVSFKKPEKEEADDKPPPTRRRRITKKEPEAPAVTASKNRRVLRGVTTVSSKGVYSKIRVVPLESAPEEPKKRGRGRPKGSLGVKKRAMQKT